MGVGPYSGGRPSGDGFGSGGWRDNVGRMRAFVKAHPDVTITVPRENGTDEFVATWTEGGSLARATDRSLGWLMDNLEARFGA